LSITIINQYEVYVTDDMEYLLKTMKMD